MEFQIPCFILKRFILNHEYKFHAKSRFTYLKFVFIGMKILVSARLSPAIGSYLNANSHYSDEKS